MSKKPYRGQRAGVCILFALAAIIAAVLGVLGYLKILFTFDLWLVIACGAIALVALIFCFWFLGVSGKAVKNLQERQSE